MILLSKSHKHKQMMRFTSIALFCGSVLFAQAPIVRTGNTEVGGFVGASYGIDQFRFMGGGNVSYALTRMVMPYAEFSYFPGIGRNDTVQIPGGGVARFPYSIPMADLHGGVHLRVPLKESKIVPYAVLGAGMLRSFSRTETAEIPLPGGGKIVIPVPVPARTDAAFNFGGGLRFYVNERYGFRAEAKAYRPTGAFTDVFGKVEFGFFYQIR